MIKLGRVIELREEAKADYLCLHRETWPSIVRIIAEANIRNYSIFLREPENLLFAYMEYHGDDFDADMERLAQEPEMKRWWALTDPMQMRLASAQPSEHWAPMAQVFFTDAAPINPTGGNIDGQV